YSVLLWAFKSLAQISAFDIFLRQQTPLLSSHRMFTLKHLFWCINLHHGDKILFALWCAMIQRFIMGI
ncbi:hypothetical protein CQA20_29210, partial [Klebsiella pneumoniae]